MKTDTYFRPHLTEFFSEWEIFQTNLVKKTKTDILWSIYFFENRAAYAIMRNTLLSRIGHRWQYGASALYVGYQKLLTRTRNM